MPGWKVKLVVNQMTWTVLEEDIVSNLTTVLV